MKLKIILAVQSSVLFRTLGIVSYHLLLKLFPEKIILNKRLHIVQPTSLCRKKSKFKVV